MRAQDSRRVGSIWVLCGLWLLPILKFSLRTGTSLLQVGNISLDGPIHVIEVDAQVVMNQDVPESG